MSTESNSTMSTESNSSTPAREGTAAEAIFEVLAEDNARRSAQPLRDYYDLPGVILELPIGGRVYRIPPPDRTAGTTMRALLAGTFTGPMTDEDFLQLALGSALTEMREAEVPKPAIVLAAYTATVDEVNGRLVAQTLWESGGNLSGALAEIEALVAPLAAAEPAPASVPEPAPSMTPSKATARKAPAKKAAAKKAAPARPARPAASAAGKRK